MKECGWCHTDPATLTVLATPTCVTCSADRKTRVRRWLAFLCRKDRS